MTTSLTISSLEGIIQKSVQEIDNAASLQSGLHGSHYFRDGGCDAFAFALQSFLSSKGEQSSLTIISRETNQVADLYDEDFEGPELVDTNDFSHCTVEALGTSWDFDGSDANDRWENDWVDSYGQETEFDYNQTDVESITSIRLEKNESTNTALVQVMSALFHAIDQEKSLEKHINACVSEINKTEFHLYKEPKNNKLGL